MERTPEEIKKGLEHCKHFAPCMDCAYADLRDTKYTCETTLLSNALALIKQLEAQVPKWISVGNPPQKESEYIMIVQLPDGKKERIWDVFHPYHGWCEDGEGKKVLCWMSFDSLPEPPKEG